MTAVCFDFGNARQKAALFRDGQFEKEVLLDSASLLQSVREVCEKYLPAHSILCSVIHHDKAIESFLAASTHFIYLDHHTPLPFESAYERPATLGMDRVALVAAAWQQFPGQHSLVIGAGTCITYNFISKTSGFLGGGISPGLQMRFRAVHEFTDRLPRVEPENNFPFIGYNTGESIRSGVLNGIVAEVDGMIDYYRLRYTNFNALLTGGDTEFFERRLKNEIFADLFLTYRGLNSILEFNAVRKT